MATQCRHKNLHTEREPYSPGMIIGNMFFGKYTSTEIKPTPEIFRTWCADCGELLKTVIKELK